MPVKVLDARGVGLDSVIAAGIVWATDHGARVINLSLGGPGTTQVLAEAVAYATAKGALVVAAAGNSGNSVPFYPAADANALSVAGTTRTDKPYEWTNRGAWVDVAAPGCNPTVDRGDRYVVFCGTSAATPLVAGLAALALSRSADLTPQALEEQIEGAALPVPGLVRYGRLRAGQTLVALTGAAAPRVERRSLAGATSARRRTRVYRLAVGEGPLSVQLTTTGNAKLTLSLLLPGRGRALKRSGRGVVRIGTKTTPGSLRLAVTGNGGKHAFMLTVDFQTAT
jgi:subtilisin family serine protease